MWFILIAASMATVPEVELQAGFMGGGSTEPKAIALSLRAAADFRDLVTLSALLVAVPGPDASYAGDYDFSRGVNPSGMRGWAALLELRVHTPGTLQWHLGAAAGLGKLANWQCNCTESFVLHGHPALMLQGSAGLRIVPPAWRGFNVGGQVAVPLWNGQEETPNPYNNSLPFQARASERLMWALSATVGYRWH